MRRSSRGTSRKCTTYWNAFSGRGLRVSFYLTGGLSFLNCSSSTVSDSLEYQPERATVVATYKKLVVGIAIMSSPQETYITYLAVKAGWDKAQISK